MGISQFFSRLREKYPSIVDRYVLTKHCDGFDNLYLDMNDIIHYCCHSDSGPLPINEEEKFEGMSKFIDMLMEIVRPKKMLYIAVDGVTPFAKNNSRRSRRFLSDKEERMSDTELDLIWHEKGFSESESSADELEFNRNLICPGTKFMSRLHVHLHEYIANKINTQPSWVGIKVILSDATVPGEGEHKIMEIVRRQKATPTHDINSRHCIYSNDADLILLGLATHEPNLSIIRKEIPLGDWCKDKGYIVRDCRIAPRQEREVVQEKFIFVHLEVLRKCLEKEMYVAGLGSGVHNINRTIDDWVFLCCLLGNDFLPKLPSLNINEKALDRLIRMYKTAVTHTMVTQTQSVRIDTEVNQRYLTGNGIVNLHMLQMILTELGKEEDVIFRERRRRIKWSEDNVRLGIDGWKDRYYEYKFDVSPSHEPEFINNLANSYVKGLCWISMYYYHGCPSWQWFYPYHYAPFAMDFINITHLQNDFEVGEPLKPLEQLMAILTPSNDHLLPTTWRPLMTDEHGDSPISDFYPDDFETDLNGEKYTSRGVARIPFVDETRLKEALEGLHLTRDEECRNRFGHNAVFLDATHPAYVFFKQFGNNNKDDEGCIVLDADKWILKQLEHQESKLYSRLYRKELEIDYYARAQRLEEIPLLKKDYEEFALMDRETWDDEEEKRIQNLKEERELSKLERNRLACMAVDRDEFLNGFTQAKMSVYKEKLENFKTMYEEERKVRLEERKERRKEERRQKWLKEKEREREEEREREKRAKQEEEKMEYRYRLAKLEEQAAKQREIEKKIEERLARREMTSRDRSEPERRNAGWRHEERKYDDSGPWRASVPSEPASDQPTRAWKPPSKNGGGWRAREMDRGGAQRRDARSPPFQDRPSLDDAPTRDRLPARSERYSDIRREDGPWRGWDDLDRRGPPPEDRDKAWARKDDRDRSGPALDRESDWRRGPPPDDRDRRGPPLDDRDRRGPQFHDRDRRGPGAWRRDDRGPPSRGLPQRDDRGPWKGSSRDDSRPGWRQEERDRGPPVKEDCYVPPRGDEERDWRRDDRGLIRDDRDREPPNAWRRDRGPLVRGDRDRPPMRDNRNRPPLRGDRNIRSPPDDRWRDRPQRENKWRRGDERPSDSRLPPRNKGPPPRSDRDEKWQRSREEPERNKEDDGWQTVSRR